MNRTDDQKYKPGIVTMGNSAPTCASISSPNPGDGALIRTFKILAAALGTTQLGQAVQDALNAFKSTRTAPTAG